MKKILGLIFLVAWVAGEAPRLWWKETMPVRPMDVAAGIIVVMDLLRGIRRIRRIRRGKVILNIGLIMAALTGAWILGPYAARTLVYGWLIWRGGEIFSRVRKWIAPAMASFLILGLGQYIFLPDTRFLLQYGWDEHYYRLIGTVLDPNYFGVMAGMIGLYAIQSANLDGVFSIRSARDPRSLRRRFPVDIKDRVLTSSSSMISKTPSSILSLLFLVIITLVLTFSRASWLAFAAAIGWWGLSGKSGPPSLTSGLLATIRRRPEERLARLQSPSATADGGQVGGLGVPADFSDEKSGYVRRRLGRLGILGSLGILGVGVWWAAPKPGGEGVNLLRTSSIQQRFTSWNEAISAWKEHPWVGTGWSREYGVGNTPSSSWLLILETMGVVGLGILGSLGILVIREIRGDRFWMGMAIMVGVHAIFNNTLFYPPVLGLLAMMRAEIDKQINR